MPKAVSIALSALMKELRFSGRCTYLFVWMWFCCWSAVEERDFEGFHENPISSDLCAVEAKLRLKHARTIQDLSITTLDYFWTHMQSWSTTSIVRFSINPTIFTLLENSVSKTLFLSFIQGQVCPLQHGRSLLHVCDIIIQRLATIWWEDWKTFTSW